MRMLIGLLFIGVSGIGALYFSHYHGTVIASPGLWYAAFIILGLMGVFLIFISTRRINKAIEQNINTELIRLKTNGEKIELDFDKCEFKGGAFTRRIEQPGTEVAKILTPGPSLYSIDTTTEERVEQSYLIYTDNFKGELCKFVSHSFPFDQTTLKFHVMRNDISLYVDRFDRNKFFFDLKS